MKFIDLFAGIGGFRTGMEMNGHECVAFCEIDKYARQSYKAMYDTTNEEELHDITQWTDEHIRQFVRDRGHIDCITGGFPCQSFSIAGKRGGFADTRGTLFFEIMRIASIVRPRYLFLENVKGLLNHDGGATFETILNTLDEFGYDAEWQVLNSKNFGVPQNRERVFIVGHLRGSGGRTVFPVRGTDTENTKADKGALAADFRYDEGFRIRKEGISPCLTASLSGMGGSNNGFSNNIYAVLTPDRIEKRQNGRRFKEDGEPMFTLTAQDRHDIAVLRPVRTDYGKEIRKAYENGEVKESRHNMTKLEPRNDEISNTITTVQKDNLLIEGLPIREATKKEYAVAEPGDSVNISFPDSETRRGRVGKQTANTLLTGEEQAVVLGGIYTNDSKEFHSGPLKGLSRTLKSDNHDAGITDGLRIRKLTPLECWRLQGFTDEQFYKAKNEGVSNSQLYKQAGNSVTVNVIDSIARRLT